MTWNSITTSSADDRHSGWAKAQALFSDIRSTSASILSAPRRKRSYSVYSSSTSSSHHKQGGYIKARGAHFDIMAVQTTCVAVPLKHHATATVTPTSASSMATPTSESAAKKPRKRSLFSSFSMSGNDENNVVTTSASSITSETPLANRPVEELTRQRSEALAPDEQADDYVVVVKDAPSTNGNGDDQAVAVDVAAATPRRHSAASTKSFKQRFWSRKGANVFDDDDAAGTDGGRRLSIDTGKGKQRSGSIATVASTSTTNTNGGAAYVPRHAASDFARSTSVSSVSSGRGRLGSTSSTASTASIENDILRAAAAITAAKRHSNDSRLKGPRVDVIVEENERESEAENAEPSSEKAKAAPRVSFDVAPEESTSAPTTATASSSSPSSNTTQSSPSALAVPVFAAPSRPTAITITAPTASVDEAPSISPSTTSPQDFEAFVRCAPSAGDAADSHQAAWRTLIELQEQQAWLNSVPSAADLAQRQQMHSTLRNIHALYAASVGAHAEHDARMRRKSSSAHTAGSSESGGAAEGSSSAATTVPNSPTAAYGGHYPKSSFSSGRRRSSTYSTNSVASTGSKKGKKRRESVGKMVQHYFIPDRSEMNMPYRATR